MNKPLPLEPCQLSARLSHRLIDAAIKDESALQSTFIGQERARDALQFGLGIDASGYNLYVMGEPATGRYTLVHEYVEKQAAQLNAPLDDWCYINNFDDEREPYVLKLAPGEGKKLVKNMESLFDEVLDTFPAVFDNPGYQRKKAAINREYEHRYNSVIDELEGIAQKKEVSLFEDGSSVSFSPIVDGKPIDDEEFTKLSDEKRNYYYDLIDELEDLLSERLIEMPQWKRETSERLRKLKKDTAEDAIRPLLKELEHKYSSELGILKFLRQMKPHLVQTVIEVLATESKDDKHDEYDKRDILEEYYMPNILTSHDTNGGAPVVYEPNPTYQNVFGRIEYSNLHGSLYTNYRMIRPGAIHKANGGYLLLDADKMIQQPFVWESLKLALKFGYIKIDSSQHDYGMVNSITLNAQPVPIDVKVVLMGTRDLYYTMQEYDDEFDELFRVLVDFDHEIALDKVTLYEFVGRVRSHIKTFKLDGISKQAMIRLVEHSLRLAEHQERLSARFANSIELLQEAAFFCRQEYAKELDVTHLERALAAKQQRSGRISESLLDDIKQGHILIESVGTAVGKVNGLTVLEIGDSVFGTPTRITSTVYPGSNGVVDIEREVDLGRAIHSKGVMLLTGYLGYKYAQEFPLTLSANIAIEQSYGHIDGDSASLAELIALLSSLTGIAIHQGLAITGSINQYGEVQPVGGVNEKVEGFFEVCRQRGFTGSQGVVIPKSNQINLMLNKIVVDAVKKGDFHIYGVETVDEAITLLTGKEAGVLSSRQNYPKGSVNYLAVARLRVLSEKVNGAPDE